MWQFSSLLIRLSDPRSSMASALPALSTFEHSRFFPSTVDEKGCGQLLWNKGFCDMHTVHTPSRHYRTERDKTLFVAAHFFPIVRLSEKCSFPLHNKPFLYALEVVLTVVFSVLSPTSLAAQSPSRHWSAQPSLLRHWSAQPSPSCHWSGQTSPSRHWSDPRLRKDHFASHSGLLN